MDDVRLGSGSLAGTGVYAARDFAAGEVVLDFELRAIDESEYLALPPGDDLFVHSYGGRRYLYPEPARFVNHADDPTCVQDFETSRNVALRPIAAGEPITIDARQETARELDTFLDAYRAALVEPSPDGLGGLVDRDAVLWRSGTAHRGRAAVVAALLAGDPLLPAGPEWEVGTGRWEALCSAGAGGRHLTLLLKIIEGNWQLRYLHLD
ncbi:SET domain-containing protein-lysine N-methyltransferase [Microlunatus sp. GCM10028923]|uniref:SET domain-containing protein-lysine N-methyltransferase n=1 Tax=Microlunatus sp. GCM10028923 TaxID=3273400 RepID=UPI00361AE68A